MSSRVIQVRMAKPGDCEAVLNINRDVYQGTDYLLNQYHTLVTDPDFCYYVCLVDGEVAAFEGVCLLDDNKTLMLRSLRVKAKFQGQGLSTPIRTALYENFKDLPGKKRFRLGCSEESRFVRSKRFLSKNSLLKTERRVRFREVDVRQLEPVKLNTAEAQPISWEEFGHLIQIASVKSYLYPDNIMSQDFWFYDSTPNNIRHMQKRCPRVFVSKDLCKYSTRHGISESSYTYNAYTDISNKDSVIKGLVGIVSSYFTPKYLYVVVNLAGNPTEGKETEEIEPILKKTLEYVQDLYQNNSDKRKLVFAFVCDRKLSEEIFYEVTKPLGMEPAKLEEDFKYQYYFEQDFANF